MPTKCRNTGLFGMEACGNDAIRGSAGLHSRTDRLLPEPDRHANVLQRAAPLLVLNVVGAAEGIPDGL